MSTQVQFRRGTSGQNDAFTGAIGEISVNTTDYTLRVHDGVTAGGFALIGISTTQTLSNKTLASPTITGNVTGAANIAHTGTISASGNVTGGNVITGGLITATGNITSTANVAGGNIVTAGLITATGNINGGNINGGANVNATTHTGTTVSVSGNITGGNITTAGIVTVNSGAAATAIVNGASNGVGNIGSSSTYFNQVFAKATTAQYADLAEIYVADAVYPAGTVLAFGGANEVTESVVPGDKKVAGVVSTQPAYVMNSACSDEFRTEVALMGKVPTRVTGQIGKGDMLVSAGNGCAMACATPEIGSVIGKSLEDFSGDNGVINVVVGRL